MENLFKVLVGKKMLLEVLKYPAIDISDIVPLRFFEFPYLFIGETVTWKRFEIPGNSEDRKVMLDFLEMR